VTARTSSLIGARLCLAAILLASVLTVIRNVGHRGLTAWDEGFHAVVARNLTKHPLTFTLYDQAWLPYDFRDWTANHVWLHKPPVALWQIAMSYWAFGVTTFTLRLPSVILATLAVWLTYRIAADLYGPRVGSIAAFGQAFNPFLFASIHGYQFSDHVDIALLFWVELSCWLLLRALRTGVAAWYALSGVALGLAYLTKSFVALVPLGIAGVVWLATRFEMLDVERCRIRLRDMALVLATAVGTAVPWVAYALARHPVEYLHEHRRVLDHLDADIEGWMATWDRHLFDYMVWFFPVVYVAVLVAALGLAWVLLRRRRVDELFVVTWIAGVVIPLSLATTKTPSAAMIAVPPLMIGLAVMIGHAWRRGDWIYTAAWFASLVAIALVPGGLSRAATRSGDFHGLAPFVTVNFWIVEQLWAALVVLVALVAVHRALGESRAHRRLWWGLRVAALAMTLLVARDYVAAAVRVTDRNVGAALYRTLGQRIRRELPENACLFLDDPTRGSYVALMYYADRSTYPVRDRRTQVERDLPSDARQARAAGAIPYLVTVNEAGRDDPRVMEGEIPVGRGRTATYRVYQLVDR
jgi:4-amino-4-deoxy-L-arabinose transferase